jgi:RND family efflux transporter MFP subunit
MTFSRLFAFVSLTLALPSFAACQKDSDAARLPQRPAATATPAAPATQPSTPTATAPPASMPTASTGSASGPLLLTGTIRPYRRSTLSPQASGRVAKVLVREGSTVKRNEPVVLLDTTDFKLRLRQALAGQATAKAQVEATRIEWRRLSTLIKDQAVPRSQFDRVDAQLKIAEAGLAQADVAVAMARQALSDATVRAPYDGIVTHVFIARGEYAAMMPPTRLVTIEEVGTLELNIQAPEMAMARISAGTPISARFAAIGKTIEAQVTRVVPSVNERTRSFSAIAELKNRSGVLRPGMFAEVRLTARGEEARR